MLKQYVRCLQSHYKQLRCKTQFVDICNVTALHRETQPPHLQHRLIISTYIFCLVYKRSNSMCNVHKALLLISTSSSNSAHSLLLTTFTLLLWLFSLFLWYTLIAVYWKLQIAELRCYMFKCLVQRLVF